MKKKYVSFQRFMRIFSDVRLPWAMLAISAGVSILNYILGVNMVQLTGDVVDASGYMATDEVVHYAVIMGLVSICTALTYLLNGVAGEKINLALRKKLWVKMMHLPRSAYDADKGEGLVSRVTGDCTYASTLFTTIVSGMSILCGVVIYLSQMFRTNAVMTWYMVLIIPVGAVVGWLYGKARYWVGSHTQSTLSAATSYLVERTRNINLIRASGMQEEEIVIGKGKFQAQYEVEIKTGLVNSLNTSINQFLPVVSMTIVFVTGGGLVAEGVLTTGAVVAFYTIAGNVATSFANFIEYFGSIRQAVGAMDRVTETFESAEEKLDEGIELDVPDEDIVADGITFAYRDEPVLRELSCVIPKNKTTAIIGANGCGKSTLFKLLERFYTPSAGTICFGKEAVSKYSLRSWRKAFGYVPQECGIMEGTLRSNICYGCDYPVSEAELKEAARQANLLELAEGLPDGFDSYVAPGGTNFSGGQRQCIAIARAIMHDPDYLLLDEATSSLDASSAHQVTEALRNLMKNRTTVMIAHDLAAIRKADYVIMIKDGKVGACGTPEEIGRAGCEW